MREVIFKNNPDIFYRSGNVKRIYPTIKKIKQFKSYFSIFMYLCL